MTARDRRFHRLITTQEPLPTTTNTRTHIVRGIEVTIAGNVPLTQLEEEWHDKNTAAYNQILLCISPELQTVIDSTDEAAVAWGILVKNHMTQAKLVSCTPDMTITIWLMANQYHHILQ